MAPSVAIPTLVPLTVHAPKREAADRRAAEDATRSAHNVAIAAAVGDGGGGACFEIDEAASPMSRVRRSNSVQSTVGMLSAYPYVFRTTARNMDNTTQLHQTEHQLALIVLTVRSQPQLC